MKRFVTLFLTTLFALLTMQAQTNSTTEKKSYKRLWTEVVWAFNDDLPKSALNIVKQIRQKAEAEQNHPQLLRSLCTEMTIAHEISSDSDSIVIHRIESAMELEKRPAERALWQHALGRLKHDPDLLLASIADTETLAAARAADYIPAFVVGPDSRCFNGDLLSVLTDGVIDSYSIPHTERRTAFHTMRSYYERQGNDVAVLVADFLNATQYNFDHPEEGELIARIRSLMPKIKKMDSDSKGNVAMVMLDWITEQEQPVVNTEWETKNRLYYPGDEIKLAVSSKNIAQIEVRIYRINDLTNITFNADADMAKIVGNKKRATLISTLQKPMQHAPSHKYFRDTLSIVLPQSGIYIAELRTDGKAKSHAWLTVSDIAPLLFSAMSTKSSYARLSIVDARTGQPITGSLEAKVRHSSSRWNREKSKGNWTVLKQNADGSFDISGLNYYDEIAISANVNHYHPVFNAEGRNGYMSDRSITTAYARLYTDRAIYRPGQKLQFGGVLYSRHDDVYKAAEGVKGTVVLQDADRKDIAELDVVSDKWGQFNGEFLLPSPTVPGRFALVFRSEPARTTEYVSVEEYKRPTFRVKLEAPECKDVLGKDRWEVGDTLTLKGLVETFSGIPIPDTSVKWTTAYEEWGWLRWNGENNDFTEKNGNSEGEVITDAEGRFSIDIVFKKEGLYRTEAIATASNGETASTMHAIHVGNPSERPRENADEKRPELFTINKNKEGDECTLTVDLRALPQMTDRPVCLFYDVVSTNGGVISSERCMLNDDSRTFSIKWLPEYGDGATAYVAFVKNNNLYSRSISVQRPLPEKRLKLAWSTFRNLLQPGEQETWTLSVRHADGTPAKASVMARMYDASLDAFASRPWAFSLDFNRCLPTTGGTLPHYFNNGPSYAKDLDLSGKEFDFTRWEPTMFDYFSMMADRGVKAMATGAMPMMYKSVAYAESAPVGAMLREAAVEGAENEAIADMAEGGAVNTEDAAAAQEAKVRENFDETAFFMPCLRTDADGNVTLNFTLPESLTQWNFTALAHSVDMDYGLLNDTIIARKKLTTEIAAPRFLREGDKTEIAVTVRNLTDEALSGTLIFLVTDAATGKALKTEKRTFALAAKNEATTLRFAITATCDVNVRAVAKAGEYSDGEERNIPFIDGRETVQVSVPFSSTQEGNIRVDLSSLNLGRLMKQDAECKPQITVEYSANPIWNVIRVVPSLLEGEACSANDWAVRLYAIEVADFLARRLHDTESGALIDSLLSAKDIPALRYSALDHLRDFQRGDGGFCWFRDFQSSPWITADVSILLARQQKMTGSTTANAMLRKALKFLDEFAAERVKFMKKEKAQSVSEILLRYLYARQLLGLPATKDSQYLLDLAAKEKKDLTMYGKSVASQILQKSHPDESALALQSLVEFTVATDEMGRYFDTDRAFGGWASYKIPTQTMAIEALGTAADAHPSLSFSPEADGRTISARQLQEQMKLWLLQSKRTQKWESSRASADATYALLHGDCHPQAPSQLFQTLAPEDYCRRALTPDENRRAIASASYNIIKDTPGLSWGAVYADYSLPIEQVEASSAGFTLTRQWEVLRDGKWSAIKTDRNGKPEAVKVGQHVRQTITLRADRDYDFVRIEASRAACLEPLHPLSGLCWMGGTSCYRMVRDSRNDYFFEHLAKGTHTLTEELIVDRSGTFQTGLARVQCTFAPEFGGYAPSAAIFAIFE